MATWNKCICFLTLGIHLHLHLVLTELCEDTNSQCKEWASWGECNRNPSYMHHDCREACGLCIQSTAVTDEPEMCEDTNRQCKVWASWGECNRNPSYMHHDCREACGLCNQSTAVTDRHEPATTTVETVFQVKKESPSDELKSGSSFEPLSVEDSMVSSGSEDQHSQEDSVEQPTIKDLIGSSKLSMDKLCMSTCMLLVNTSRSWDSSKQWCQQNGGRLLSVPSRAVEDHAVHWMKVTGYNDAWIGAHALIQNVTRTPPNPRAKRDRPSRGSGPPSDPEQKSESIALEKKGNQWQAIWRNSFDTYPYICINQTQQGQCSNTYHLYRSTLCVKFVTSGQSWFLARQACIKEGASLYTDSTFDINISEVVDLFRDPLPPGSITNIIWTNNSTISWYWTDDEVVMYTNWVTSSDIELELHKYQCVQLYIQNQAVGWKTNECNDALPFFCEFDRDTVQDLMPQPESSSSSPTTSITTTTTRSTTKPTTASTPSTPRSTTVQDAPTQKPFVTSEQLLTSTKLPPTRGPSRPPRPSTSTTQLGPVDEKQTDIKSIKLALYIGIPVAVLAFIGVGVACILTLRKFRKKAIEKAVVERINSTSGLYSDIGIYSGGSSLGSTYNHLPDNSSLLRNNSRYHQVRPPYEALGNGERGSHAYQTLDSDYATLDVAGMYRSGPSSRMGSVRSTNTAVSGQSGGSLHYDYADPNYNEHTYLELLQGADTRSETSSTVLVTDSPSEDRPHNLTTAAASASLSNSSRDVLRNGSSTQNSTWRNQADSSRGPVPASRSDSVVLAENVVYN